MAIERVTTLKQCAVFRDFAWPSDLADFARFNLIYGWNGTGKTTLSRTLRDLELRRPPELGEVGLQIDGQAIAGSDFPSATTLLRVFNRDFVDDTVLPRDGGDAPPIFVVGPENVGKQREVDALKGQKTAPAEFARLREAEQSSLARLERSCQDRAKAIKDQLRSSTAHRYNDYDKSDFTRDIEKLEGVASPEDAVLDGDAFETMRSQLSGTPRAEIVPIEYRLPALKDLAERVEALLGRTVVLDGLAALADDPQVDSWLRVGHLLHGERDSADCLYCSQAIPTQRLAALDEHFNARRNALESEIGSEIDSLQRQERALDEIRFPEPGLLYDEFALDYGRLFEECTSSIGACRDSVEALVRLLRAKQDNLYRAVPFSTPISEPESEPLTAIRGVIDKHNSAARDFAGRVSAAREAIAASMLAESLANYRDAKARLEDAQAATRSVEAQNLELDRQIRDLEAQIIAHRQPAEDLTREIATYLGHDELHFQVKDTGYTISRAGGPAFRLSEGERTAIALLYFLKSLSDRAFEMDAGTVVFDDPVSSLDENSLFAAFGAIRTGVADAGQVFVLTHNFALFRQVRGWFLSLPGQKKASVAARPARFYMLKCRVSAGTRWSRLEALDPLLERFESEYHYLFSAVVEAARSGQDSPLEANYHLPNMARRVLETFLEFRKPGVGRTLDAKMAQVEYDPAVKMRILRFVHAHSHGDEVGENEHDLSVLAETPAVMASLLAFMESEDPAHVSAMRLLISGDEPAPGSTQ